jgi:hypothetical protein
VPPLSSLAMMVNTPLLLSQLCLNFRLSQLMAMVINTPYILFQLYLTIFVVVDGDQRPLSPFFGF